MRLSHFSLCLLTAAICTQLYAEDTATNDSTTQNTEAKLPTIVMTATRTPKSISEIAGTEPYRVCRRVNILRDYPDDKIKIYP